MSRSVSDIVTRVRTDFSASIHVDLTVIQSLFKGLCENVISMQNELDDLRKELREKCNKADLDAVSDSLKKNYAAHDELAARIEELEKRPPPEAKPPEVVSRSLTPPPVPDTSDLEKRLSDCEAGLKRCEAKLDSHPESADPQEKDKPESKPNTPPKSSNTDDMLDLFMDACKQEIAAAKLDMMKDFDGKVKSAAAQLTDNIAKNQAETNDALKKNQGMIEDLENKLAENTAKLEKDLTDMVQKLKSDLAGAGQRIDSIEHRLDAMQTGPDLEMLKNALSGDGKVDTETLVGQIGALAQSLNDTNAKVAALEKRETVSPERLDAMAESMAGLTVRAQKLEQADVKTELKLAQLQESIDELKESVDEKGDGGNAGDAQKRETAEDSDSIREEIVKCQRDILGNRAAIKTLRQHSEETRNLSDEANRVAYDVRTDMDNAEEKRKKFKALMKEKTASLADQIKELREMLNQDGGVKMVPSLDKMKGKITTQKTTATSPHVPTSPVDTGISVEKEPPPVGITEYCDPPPPAPIIKPHTPEKPPAEQTIVAIPKPKPEVTGSVQKRKPLPRLGTNQGRREPEVSKSDLKKFDDLLPRAKDMEQAIAAVRTAVEQLNKNVKQLNDTKADKAELQNVFDQFRMAMGEMNQRVGSLRKAVVGKADSTELRELQKALMREVIATGETAAGAEAVRCLTCGRPRDHVTGTIDDPDIIRQIGPAMSSRVTTVDGDGTACFVYGEHGEMFLGRSVDGRPIFSRRERERDSLIDSLPPPATAPTPTRHYVEVSSS